MDWAVREGVPLHPGSLPGGFCGLHSETLLPTFFISPQHNDPSRLHGSCMSVPQGIRTQSSIHVHSDHAAGFAGIFAPLAYRTSASP